MTDLTPAMDAALSADRPLIFGAVEINLPGGVNVRLLDGAGEIGNWQGTGGAAFVGRDATFGVLAAIDPPEDGTGDQAPAMNITLHPPSTAAAAALAAPNMQGSRVRLWLGAIDRAAGGVVADPYLLFDGELDQPILSVDRGERELEYECVSGMERLFDTDEGMRLADSFHQSVWPGETGLANVTGIVKTIIWGPGDRPSSITYGGEGFSGGGVAPGRGGTGGLLSLF